MCQLPNPQEIPYFPLFPWPRPLESLFSLSPDAATRLIELAHEGPLWSTPTYYPAGDWSGYVLNQFPGKSDKENKLGYFLFLSYFFLISGIHRNN